MPPSLHLGAPPNRPASRKLQPLRALAPYLRPYRWHIAGALLALAVAAGASLVMPVAAKLVIDQGFSVVHSGHIGRYFLAFMAVVIVLGLASATRYFIVTWVGEHVVADVRTGVYTHILSLSPAFFDVTRTGEVLSRLNADTTLVQTVIGSSASFALRSVVTVLGALIMMAFTSFKLTLLCFIAVPFTLLLLISMGRSVRGLSRIAQDRLAYTAALAGETINAIRTVQAYTHESVDRGNFMRATGEAVVAAIKRTRARAILTAAVIMMVGGCIVGVLWVGANDVLDHRMSGGELAQFIIYAVMLASSAGALSELWGEIQRAAGATERLLEILGTPPAIHVPATPAPLPSRLAGRVRFENVRFNYPTRPEHAALNELTFDVRAGEAVALVGPSGAGKSTVFQLLLRYYDTSAGRILVDGLDINSVDPIALRRQIAVVSQEATIFAGTIADNIRYGRPDASDAEIRAAAVAAAADEFIQRLPRQYETLIGERGTTLSGGQRQRVAIARAMLRDAPILLLDEATSALDAENERLVQQGLDNLMAGTSGRPRTTLVIAHRLATIQRLKRIIVLDHGRFAAEGDHESLVRQGGLYARLAALQFSTDSGA